MLAKTLLIFGAVLLAFCGVAHADVPDPFGRPRPGVIRKAMSYEINRVGFFFTHETCPKDKLMLELTCNVPKNAIVFYKVKNAKGEVIEQSNAKFSNGYGDIPVYIDKPKPGKSSELIFDSVCELYQVDTRFGAKESDKPVFKAKLVKKFIVSLVDNEYELNIEHID